MINSKQSKLKDLNVFLKMENQENSCIVGKSINLIGTGLQSLVKQSVSIRTVFCWQINRKRTCYYSKIWMGKVKSKKSTLIGNTNSTS